MKGLAVILGAVAFVMVLSTSFAIAQNACEGNFDCDQDVDGTDAAVFKLDFGRSQFKNPCPDCISTCDPPAPVPRTGQTTSYSTGDDGDYERGVPFPSPRFTDNGDGTVKDNLTGLIWLKDANCFGTRTWNNALADASGLEDGFCGLTDFSSAGDWRLPNRFELGSLLDLHYYGPALSSTTGTAQWTENDPFINVQQFSYWSSTTYAFNSDFAWDVFMYYGSVGYNGKLYSAYVWPVRGGF